MEFMNLIVFLKKIVPLEMKTFVNIENRERERERERKRERERERERDL